MKRPILSMHLLFTAAAMLLITGQRAHATATLANWPAVECYVNCVSFYRHKDRLLVVGKNGNGDIVATGWVRMPAIAHGPLDSKSEMAGRDSAGPNMLGGTNSGFPGSGTCLGTTGTCVDQSVMRFETNTHVIIVTVTYFFINGELHDIDVREKRFAKNKIK